MRTFCQLLVCMCILFSAVSSQYTFIEIMLIIGFAVLNLFVSCISNFHLILSCCEFYQYYQYTRLLSLRFLWLGLLFVLFVISVWYLYAPYSVFHTMQILCVSIPFRVSLIWAGRKKFQQASLYRCMLSMGM